MKGAGFTTRWKAASGRRYWRDFWMEEYGAKADAIRAACAEVAREVGYDSEPIVALGARAWCVTIVRGFFTSDGTNSAQVHTIDVPGSPQDMAHDFDNALLAIKTSLRDDLERVKAKDLATPSYRAGWIGYDKRFNKKEK